MTSQVPCPLRRSRGIGKCRDRRRRAGCRLVDLCAGLAGLFGLGSAVGPYRADRAAHRANPAFALLIGDGLVPPRTIGEQTPARVTLQDALFSR